MTGVRLRDTGSGQVSRLAVTGVFVAIGHDPRSELVRDEAADPDPEGYVLVQGRTTSTSIDGRFRWYLVDRTYRQAVTAAGSGCSAAI